MSITIKESTFKEILPLWEKLWPGRDDIKYMSSMLDGENWDLDIYYKYEPVFFAAIDDETGKIVGVNSGHPTTDSMYRSRGLYVEPEYRNQGLGKKLLDAAIGYARKRNYDTIWSFPKKDAWSVYKAAGFKIVNDFNKRESYTIDGNMTYDTNAYVEKKLK